MSDKPIIKPGLNGVNLFKRTKANGETYWIARIRIAAYKQVTLNENTYRKQNCNLRWEDARALFVADVEKRAIELNQSATLVKNARDKEAELSGKSVSEIKAELPQSKVVIPLQDVNGHKLDDIMGCKVEPICALSGKPYSNGKMHNVTIEGNLYDQEYGQRDKYATIKKYHETYYNYIHNEGYGSKTIESITKADIVDTIKKASYKVNQMHLSRILKIWKRLITIGVQHHWNVDSTLLTLESDQMPAPDYTAVDKRRTRTNNEYMKVEDSEFKQVINAIAEDKGRQSATGHFKRMVIIHALILMRLTGLRPSECFALRIQDLNFAEDKKSVVINVMFAQSRRANGKLVLDNVKTKKSARKLPLDVRGVEVLDSLIELNKQRVFNNRTKVINYSDGSVLSNNDLLFADMNGNILDPTKVQEIVRERTRPLGIKYSLYSNRHQVANDLGNVEKDDNESPINDKTKMDVVGHTNIKTTYYYMQKSEKDVGKALKKVGSTNNRELKQILKNTHAIQKSE